MHGNGWHVLRALDSMAALVWLGQGALHGGARASLVWGIVPLGQGRSGGEVMAQELNGGALPRSGALGGHGGVLGVRGLVEGCLCDVGSG
jgi:hypothetical protein